MSCLLIARIKTDCRVKELANVFKVYFCVGENWLKTYHILSTQSCLTVSQSP